MWLFGSENSIICDNRYDKINFSNAVICTDEKFVEYRSKDFHIVVFGNPWPRFNIQDLSKKNEGENWLVSLVQSYGKTFIDFIKGDFVIFLELDNLISIYNDHFGCSAIYFNTEKDILSNDFQRLQKESKTFNPQSISHHILYNRTIGEKTYDAHVLNKGGANAIEYSSNSFGFNTYWDYKTALVKSATNYSLQQVIDFCDSNIKFFYDWFNVDATYITLTGGKDSRSALSILLHQGIEPIGINYGDPASKDVVYAKEMARKIGIECHNVFVETSSNAYVTLIDDLVSLDPMTSIHRAHRLAAFKTIGKDTRSFKVLFNGYLGGELLMGIYPDKLVFTETILKAINKLKIQSNTNFFETELVKSFMDQQERNTHQIENELDAIFRIGIKHHLQDIHLSKKHCNYVFPFFLDVDFIERIFKSDFNFTNVDNQSYNLFKRYNLYKLNCELQYQLAPILRNIPFAKKGNYTLNDYKKGPLYWSMIKVVNHIKETKYPPNFVYSVNYRDWLIQQFDQIKADQKSQVHQFFNVSEALQCLKRLSKITFSEAEMLVYTRIWMFYKYLSK